MLKPLVQLDVEKQPATARKPWPFVICPICPEVLVLFVQKTGPGQIAKGSHAGPNQPKSLRCAWALLRPPRAMLRT